MYDRHSELWRGLARLKRGYESNVQPETMYDNGMTGAAEIVTSDHDELIYALDALARVRALRSRHTSFIGRLLLRLVGLSSPVQ